MRCVKRKSTKFWTNPRKSKKATTGNVMATRHLSKNLQTVYEIGEQVLMKLLISDKKIRGKKKNFDFVK